MKTSDSLHKFMIFLLIYLLIIPDIFVGMTYFLMEHISKADYLIFVSIAVSFLSFAVPGFCYIRFILKKPILSVIPHKKLTVKSLLLIIGITIFSQPAITFVSAFFGIFFDNRVSDTIDTIESTPIMLQLLAIAVTPALFEEFIFRGLILELSKKLKFWQIVFISGLYFGIMHMDFHQFSYAFPMGMIFAILVYGSDSIFASMIPHFLFNATAVLASNAAASYGGTEEYAEEAFSVSDTLLYMAGVFPIAVICSVIVFFMIKYYLKINKNRSMAARVDYQERMDSIYANYMGYSPYMSFSEHSGRKNRPLFTKYFWIVIALYFLLMLIMNLVYGM